MKAKLEQKISSRLLDRLEKGGLNVALEYGVAVCAGYPHITKALVSCAPEPLKTMLDAAIAARRSKRQGEAKAAIQAAQDQDRNRLAQAQAMASDLQRTRNVGQATVFLAGLTMAERAQCGATRQELADAIELRRGCIRSTRVKEVLSCSDTELKRWAGDGRLPVLFRRRMPSSTAGITLDVRHWDLQLVDDALQHLEKWRDDDTLAKRQKRAAQIPSPRAAREPRR